MGADGMTQREPSTSFETLAAADERDERALERRQIAACLEGDARAFRGLVERHHRGLFALTYRMVGDRAEADDLVQEAFARAYRSLDDYDDAFRFSTWLYRIALNLCRDFLKSPRRRERPGHLEAELDGHSEPTPGADAELARAATIQRVRLAVEQLAPSYREVIVLKDLQDLSYEEIHAITGDPVTALKIRVVRARAKLRVLLEEKPR